MRQANLVAALLMALLLVGPVAHAVEAKIAVIDVEYVVLKSKKGQAAKKKLKALYEKKQKELDAKQNTLLELKEKLENPSSVETAESRRKSLMEYQQGVMKLQEDFVENQQALGKKEMDLMKPILETLEKVLNDFAASGDYDLIMNRSQQGVIFAKPSFDVTERILKALDEAGAKK
ncbi:MAG: OmpH family outer membrane protein [Deltaproteobacteria bacterium]|nr:OmpH family outer membrane protein [Deltaproteobacteria bacterium]MCB9785973.1 OmpH family outer membrane protein [Deltaproteobacteria bacterium]